MKIMLIILTIILILYILSIYILKNYRKKEAKRINQILLHKHLGDSSEKITEYIKNNNFDNLIKIENYGKYEHIFSMSNSQKTIKVYQLLNDICTSFYIQSFEEKYSLPYWNYIKQYTEQTKFSKGYRYRNEDRLGLAAFTRNRYLEPFINTEKEFEEDLNFYFPKYVKVNPYRFLSINVDNPISSPSNYPLYLYLCSSNLNDMQNFRKNIYDIYENYLCNFEIPSIKRGQYPLK